MQGDIGQMMPDGTIRIIDRKKDLVKLQGGEYVSLGKVESLLKLHKGVENVCIYADPSRMNTVAMVIPTAVWLKRSRPSWGRQDCQGKMRAVIQKLWRNSPVLFGSMG